VTSVAQKNRTIDPPQPPSKTPHAVRWRFKTLLVSLALGLLISELVARALGWGYAVRTFPIVGDPVVHHWQPRNLSVTVRDVGGQYGPFETHFNSDGLAMRSELPPAGTPSVIFLGDSYTLGIEVHEAHRFVTRVGDRLGLPALNLGCPSFCPLLSRLVLERFEDRVTPRAVVLMLYNNDVADESRWRATARKNRDGRIVGVPGDAHTLWRRLCERSAVARLALFAREAWRVSRTRDLPTHRLMHDAPWLPAVTSPIRPHPSDPSWLNIRESILDIRQICAQKDATLFLCAVPDRGALRSSIPDYFSDYVGQIARECEIEFIDLPAAFRGHDPQKLYYPVDIHFTEEGHRIAAEAIAESLAPAIK